MFEKFWYWALLRNVRVLFIGESHTEVYRKKFAKLIPILKRNGVEAIGLEMWRDGQNIIDSYFKDSKNSDKLMKRLIEEWGVMGVPEATKELIDIAKENCVQIFFFNIISNEYKTYAKGKDQLEAAEWRQDEMAKALIEKVKRFRKAVVLVGSNHLSARAYDTPLQEFLREAEIRCRVVIWNLKT